MTPEPTVLVENHGPVRQLTLNRPDRRNAFTPAMTELFADLLVDAGRDPSVRAIVVAGSGDHWSVGADRKRLAELANHPAPPQIPEDIGRWDVPRRIPKPVIAAIGGNCAGIAMVIALSCDVRFAAADVTFSTAYSRLGLVAERGLSWLLTHTCSPGVAIDLLLSSRKVGADEASRIGLVSEVTEPGRVQGRALEYASELAGTISPWSMAMIKQQFQRDLQGSYPEAVRRAMGYTRIALDRAEFRELRGNPNRRLGLPPPLPSDWTAPES
ncbi:enoyl-CoA hydratase/isomerase family protein [Nakamurella lactea]|uniref:enoyl-CoA hydratase/isomerase family protein n=1 Tax=Nakamurella lactea TaxID=459515 RepID=UPI000411C140|nr:enoyl-CoA hydratase-related protein [Nakamurella lactea]